MQDEWLVLDFPANTRARPGWFRALRERSKVPHELHSVDATDEVCKRQLRERSREFPEGAAAESEDVDGSALWRADRPR